MSELYMTAGQREAMAQQAAAYAAADSPCQGLLSARAYDANEEWDGAYPPGSIGVNYTYLHADGAPGLEVVIFGPRGAILEAQDFG